MKNYQQHSFFYLGAIMLFAMTSCGSTSAQKQYKLTYVTQDTTLDPSIKLGIENIYYKIYPKLVKDFNPDARKEVIIKIDTSYTGVAYASNGAITIRSAWLHKKPEDLDLVTHELMHIVQSYPNGAGPGWLTEGIADYVRHVYGLDNKGAGWSLTPFSKTQSYKNSYRITARFLIWITQKYDKSLVIKLDQKLRAKEYDDSLWKASTGKTLDGLWEEYSADPKLDS